MKKNQWTGWIVALFGGLLGAAPAWAATDEQQSAEPPQTAELLRYTRLYTGADGATHFEDIGVSFVYQDYGKGIPPVWFPAEGIREAAGFHFVSMPANWDGGDWHPAPRRQFIIPLSGQMMFEVSDGERRVFGAGDVLLVEDTKGKGHISRMISTSLGVFAVVPLPE